MQGADRDCLACEAQAPITLYKAPCGPLVGVCVAVVGLVQVAKRLIAYPDNTEIEAEN